MIHNIEHVHVFVKKEKAGNENSLSFAISLSHCDCMIGLYLARVRGQSSQAAGLYHSTLSPMARIKFWSKKIDERF